jgi:hypothetical protein
MRVVAELGAAVRVVVGSKAAVAAVRVVVVARVVAAVGTGGN